MSKKEYRESAQGKRVIQEYNRTYAKSKVGKEKALAYTRTSKGLTCKIYNRQKYHSKCRGHIPPQYTLEEFRDWIFCKGHFVALMKDWEDSDYDKWLKPSVDRLDDSKGYTLNNLQLVTWRVNFDKGAIANRNRRKKPIIKFTKEGEVISGYESSAFAAKVLGLTDSRILKCCRGSLKTYKGFVWGFYEDVFG